MDDDSDYEEIEEGEFIVERIINHKFINGKCYYLLKWKDFDDRENTWEEESSLDCPNLLEEYQDLNIERIEQDRIASQELEMKKKLKKEKELTLLKNIIDSNSNILSAKKINSEPNNSDNHQFQFESLNNLSRTQNIRKQKEDLWAIKSTFSSIPKTPKLPNSKYLTITGHKIDLDDQLVFSVARKDGKIINMTKCQLMQEDSNLYIKFLEESIFLKHI